MAKLTSERRDKLPDSKFALPGHKYPVEDAVHARNAKARAAQQVKAGNLSKAEEKSRCEGRQDPQEGMTREHPASQPQPEAATAF